VATGRVNRSWLVGKDSRKVNRRLYVDVVDDLRDDLRCILLTWSLMLSTRLNTLSHPSHSHKTPGLCFASCLARSFLLENPPPCDCGQSPCRQKKDLVCRLWCFRRSHPLVKTALDVHPGYAQLHVPFLLGMPYARRSGEEGERDRESEGGDASEGTLDAIPWPTDDDVECDLDGRVVPGYCESRVESWERIVGDPMSVNGG
jgi:hypothetical protein